ncbi:trimeric intracellular cation channel family protein [Gulosibacter molinativorax]|uniref:trimeric intracellular cation channel family protein n=1 Tax=Gulosibacter molinativorax TaxID=256821 RepID=UPI00223F2758|nr:TRIC cation channel family protein [Gulosibacter molinativorax]
MALAGALIAFFITRPHRVFNRLVMLFDTVGLSLFCVVGAVKALDYGLGPFAAILLGTITAVGGGTIRDVMTAKVPTILTSSSGLYAIPALLGAGLVVGLILLTGGARSVIGIPFELLGAALCFAIRAIGIRFNINAPASRLIAEIGDGGGSNSQK